MPLDARAARRRIALVRRNSPTSLATLLSMLLIALAAPACGGRAEEPEPEPTSGEEEVVVADPEPEPEPEPVRPPVPAFTATPSIDDVGTDPVHGWLNDVDVLAENVELRNEGGRWLLFMSAAQPFFELTIPLHEAPRASHPQSTTEGERPGLERPGAIQVPHPSLGAVSWNGAEIGWALDLSSFPRGACRRRERADRELGTASGRVVVSIHDPGAGTPESFVSGSFIDVPVRCLATQ